MSEPPAGRNLIGSLSPFGRGFGVRGFEAYRKTITLTPRLSLREREQLVRGLGFASEVAGSSLHRTVLRVRIGVVLEHLLDDLGLEFTVRALGDLDQIEILDRIVISVEL